MKQDLDAPAVFNAPFDLLDGSYKAPFHETEVAARLDYKLSSQSQLFYRFTYDNGSDVNSFGGANYQPLKSHDDTFGNAGRFRFHPRTVSSIAFALPTTATPTRSWTPLAEAAFSILPLESI